MGEDDVEIPADGLSLRATLSRPDGRCLGGVVLLHPSDNGSRDQFLFEDLAQRLPLLGLSVLRYDRRQPLVCDADVSYEVQVADLQAALGWLRGQLGSVHIGLWGFSQGAWIALLAAAADPSIAFIALVGGSAVSPAIQMRYGTSEQLRRAGYRSEKALADLVDLRHTWEQWQRGALSSDEAQATISRFTDEPWFELSWVPPVLPSQPSWTDIDFDPADTISKLTCPVCAFYGNDEWVPVADSIRIWQSRIPDPHQLTIHQLEGTGHHPTLNDGRTTDTISPDYIETLNRWLLDRLG